MKVEIGTISHGTMLTQDLIPVFVTELKRLDPEFDSSPFDMEVTVYADEDEDEDEDEDDIEDYDSDELLSELFDKLNEWAPPYCYFGAHPGDGSDYGFWPEEDFQQRAKEDGVESFTDLADIPDDYEGEYAIVVNDHGNTTLYKVRHEWDEVWSIV